jgi:hypothetical protein
LDTNNIYKKYTFLWSHISVKMHKLVAFSVVFADAEGLKLVDKESVVGNPGESVNGEEGGVVSIIADSVVSVFGREDGLVEVSSTEVPSDIETSDAPDGSEAILLYSMKNLAS